MKRAKVALIILVLLLLIPFLGLKVGCSFTDTPTAPANASKMDAPSDIEGYARPEEVTYLTYTEWHIVYSSAEYADHLKTKRPSSFPYLSSIGQLWSGYCSMYRFTAPRYGFSFGDHFMLWVIGSSFSVENAVKSVYENTMGRVTEWISGGANTEEDRFAAEMNERYVRFIYDHPFYDYSYAEELGRLWTETDYFGPNVIRKWERRWVLSAELAFKAAYGGFIAFGTHTMFGFAPLEMHLRASNVPASVFEQDPRIKKIREEGDGSVIMRVPRYREFSEIMPDLAKQGVRFRDIAGNDEILMTAIVPRGWENALADSTLLFRMELLTRPGFERVGLWVPVASLSEVLNGLQGVGATLEHLYDY